MQGNKKKVLIHACCAPCSTHVIDNLAPFYNIAILFYNPNIQPDEEYKKRLQEIKKLCEIKKTELIVPENDENLWLKRVKGLEDVPEGGGRCALCFDIRLMKAADIAIQKSFHMFATTLTVSPYKNSSVINSIGNKVAGISGVNFLDSDFKKKDGYKKSCELSRQYGLYRQRYCGCLYSMRLNKSYED